MFLYMLLLLNMLPLESKRIKEPKENEYYVTALVGSVAKLPCGMTIDKKMGPLSLVLWYKEGIQVPIYSLDARNSDLYESVHWSDGDVLEDRAYFNTSSQSVAILDISNLKEKDEGLYRCRIDYKSSKTKNFIIHLKVITSPGRPRIFYPNGTPLRGKIGPYNEGDKLQMICQADGGKPMPQITWWKGNTLLDSTYEASSAGWVRNILVLKGLTRNDVSANLICKASNSNITKPLTASVVVEMNLRAIKVELLGLNKPLSAGVPHDVTCLAFGSRPPAIFEWRKNKQKVEEKYISNDSNRSVSVLVITPTKQDNNTFIECSVYNNAFPSHILKTSKPMEIYYRPELTIRMGMSLNPENIIEGNDVFFECHIDSYPHVSNISWYHEGVPLESSVQTGLIISNQTLAIQKVGRTHAGIYNCAAWNVEGPGHSAGIYLKVKFSPVCSKDQEFYYEVGKREDVLVSCEVHAVPEVTDFHWAFNNTAEMIQISPRYYFNNGNKSVVKYKPITDLDFGTLICWATNAISKQTTPCVYHILPTGKPNPVNNCSYQNVSYTSYLIQCGQDRSLDHQQVFNMEVYSESQKGIVRNMTASHPKFIIKGIEPNDTYVMKIWSMNQKGRSKEVQVIVPPHISESSRKVSPTVSSLSIANKEVSMRIMVPIIGAIATIILLLILIFVVVVYKKKQYEPKNILKDSLSNLHCEVHDDPSTYKSLHFGEVQNDLLQPLKENPEMHHRFADVTMGTPTEFSHSEIFRTSDWIPNNEHLQYAELSSLNNFNNQALSRRFESPLQTQVVYSTILQSGTIPNNYVVTLDNPNNESKM